MVIKTRPTREGRERWHGTAGGYINHGCRGPKCKKAHAETIAAYRQRHKEKGLCVNCSAPATRGLRCDRHADARLDYARRMRAR